MAGWGAARVAVDVGGDTVAANGVDADGITDGAAAHAARKSTANTPPIR